MWPQKEMFDECYWYQDHQTFYDVTPFEPEKPRARSLAEKQSQAKKRVKRTKVRRRQR